MRESKAELTDRLRREGRFEAFKKRREELKAGGTAASDAWDVAAAEFPSLDAKPDPGTVPKADPQALKGKPPVSIVQAAAWAFEQLDCDWITPADAPSPGAWSLREWARSSMSARSEFYRTFVAKLVMPPQEEARQAQEAAEAHHRELEKRLSGDPQPPDPPMSKAEEDARMERLFGPTFKQDAGESETGRDGDGI
jgi:hypothetical protein